MEKYHINPFTRDVSLCRSTQGKCPFGGEQNHFSSAEDAYMEVERQLSEEFKSQSLSKAKMVPTFEEWQAEKNGTAPKAAAPSPTVGAYVTMIGRGQEPLAHYAQKLGLTLEEARQIKETLRTKPKLIQESYSAVVRASLEARIKDAKVKEAQLDESLSRSVFFTKSRTIKGTHKTGVETTVTVGDEDFITYVAEDGSSKFEIYDHATGESSIGRSPLDWSSDDGSTDRWAVAFESYKKILQDRAIESAELRRREARLSEVFGN